MRKAGGELGCPLRLSVLRTLGPLATSQPLSLPVKLQRLNLPAAEISKLGDNAGKPKQRAGPRLLATQNHLLRWGGKDQRGMNPASSWKLLRTSSPVPASPGGQASPRFCFRSPPPSPAAAPPSPGRVPGQLSPAARAHAHAHTHIHTHTHTDAHTHAPMRTWRGYRCGRIKGLCARRRGR